MKEKRKILAIFIILLMLAIPFSIAQAGEATQKNTAEENVTIQYASYQDDGTITTDKITMTEEELTEFENAVSLIMDEIQAGNDFNGIWDLIQNYLGGNHLILNMVTGVLLKFKNIFNRALVISSGHGLRFNPLKKSQFKIRKGISLWHYSSDSPIKDRTIILKPLALKLKILKGAQFGIMTKFTGIYLYISRTLPQKSYTFFFGTAKHINGIQLPSISR